MSVTFNIPSDEVFNDIVEYRVKGGLGRSYLPISKHYKAESPDKALRAFEDEFRGLIDRNYFTYVSVVGELSNGDETLAIITKQ